MRDSDLKCQRITQKGGLEDQICDWLNSCMENANWGDLIQFSLILFLVEMKEESRWREKHHQHSVSLQKCLSTDLALLVIREIILLNSFWENYGTSWLNENVNFIMGVILFIKFKRINDTKKIIFRIKTTAFPSNKKAVKQQELIEILSLVRAIDWWWDKIIFSTLLL